MTAADGSPAGRITSMAAALYSRGWMPGTAGNISARCGDDRVLITGSGRSKGELTAEDLVVVGVHDSTAVAGAAVRPSAETVIHTAIYRATGCQAVVHVHPPHATAVSTRHSGPEGVPFENYELLKGLGTADPVRVVVPVFPNWADVARIAADVEVTLGGQVDAPPVLLIEGHGATAWGNDLGQARDRMECLEALCELVMLTGRTRSGDEATTGGTR